MRFFNHRLIALMAFSLWVCPSNGYADTPEVLLISVAANGDTVVFELNNSLAAQTLYNQLPLSIAVENYGNNEKIFYPPRKLNVSNTPLAKEIKPGTLAYYAPWDDVVMFYDSFQSAPGLFELGSAKSGKEHIKDMSGTLQIMKKTNK